MQEGYRSHMHLYTTVRTDAYRYMYGCGYVCDQEVLYPVLQTEG